MVLLLYRLKTQLKEFSVEDSPFSVPASIDALGKRSRELEF
jgi:hypothetical protein